MTSPVVAVPAVGGDWVATPSVSKAVPGSFEQLLGSGVDAVNRDVASADRAVQLLSVGATDNLPEVMLALENARTSVSLMFQVRDRMVEAYREVLQMQI